MIDCSQLLYGTFEWEELHGPELRDKTEQGDRISS